MKITIGINTFKKLKDFNNREIMCYQSLLKIKSKFTDTVEICNIIDEKEHEIEGFKNIKKVLEYFNSDGRQLPFVNQFFDILSENSDDYFIFINNDLAVSDRFVKSIQSNPNKDCFPASKLHFTKLDSINDPAPIPQSVSVHGFEGFGVKKQWWTANRKKFKKMVLGCAYWDTYFFTKCMLYGDCMVLNKPPLPVFHLDHKSESMEQSSGNSYNEQVFVTDSDHLGARWFGYVQNVLLKRATHNNILWYVPFDNEVDLEKKYFTL